MGCYARVRWRGLVRRIWTMTQITQLFKPACTQTSSPVCLFLGPCAQWLRKSCCRAGNFSSFPTVQLWRFGRFQKVRITAWAPKILACSGVQGAPSFGGTLQTSSFNLRGTAGLDCYSEISFQQNPTNALLQ